MSISTLSLNSATRASILRLQGELRDAEKEISTLRHADVGRTLGAQTGNAVSFRAQETSIDRLLDSNKLVASRFELMDDSLATVATGAEDLLTSLIGGLKDDTSARIVVEQAKGALAQMAAALNINVGGQYLFAGAQTDFKPLRDDADAKAAIAASYGAMLTAAGGATPATVTAADLGPYLGGDFAALFSDATDPDAVVPGPVWRLLSGATDAPVETRISKTETIESSLSANSRAFRDIAAAYSMLSDLDLETMNEAAQKTVVEAASKTLKQGLDGTVALRAELGFRLSRVETAETQLTQQKDIVRAAFQRLENVDITEASLRVTQLETQLEASYTITGRLQNLNILNYL